MDDSTMDDVVDLVTATAPYDYRVPSPHRVHIPPPALTEAGEPALDLSRVVPQPDLEMDFLNNVQCGHLYDRNFMLNNGWTYDRRRSATEILPYLYLGPMTAARDVEALKRDGITMLLAVAHRSTLPSRMTIGPMRAASELGLQKESIEVADHAELIAAFPHAIRLVNEHLFKKHQEKISSEPVQTSLLSEPSISGVESQTGKVLVFCESGNERSAAVVAAYLIHMFHDIDHIKACQMCNTRRFSTNLDDGLKQCLFTYHEIVRAQRDVHATRVTEKFEGTAVLDTQHSSLPAHASGKKRNLDITMSDESEEGELDDIERFSGRDFVPFRDADGLV